MPNTHANDNKHISAVIIAVSIYMFLFIERPWESIRYLKGIPIERVAAIIMIVVAFIKGRFKIVNSPTNKWVYGLLALHFILAPFAYNSGFAVDQGIEYAKMVILYLLMLAVADDEKSLKVLIKAYVFSMMFYMFHSLWEYHNGRHVWRMGISRMIGVDDTFSDPNEFGGSIVLSLPFVYALIRTEEVQNIRKIFYIYLGLALLCIVLTGSRSASVAIVALVLMYGLMHKGKKKLIVSTVVLLSIGAVWMIMPEEKQNRIRTLWDANAGPENAKNSADGRMLGWSASWRMFKQTPFTGVGAGGKNYIGYRMANQVDVGDRAPYQSHILYGEVLAEFGIIGAILFLGLVVAIFKICINYRSYTLNLGVTESFSHILAGAIILSLMLLLLLGIGGHNFYRPLWLWLAAWTGALFQNIYLREERH